MQIQKSFVNQKTEGELYLVGTPIGNLEDMTFRAINILKEVNLIAAEDTRQTRKLLTHFDIHTPLHSYHEHNKEQSAQVLLSRLQNGEKIALVSDAGMPAISDPGYELVVAATELGMSVIPIPGPNAAISALVCSGLATNRFHFVGFLPRTKKQRKESLETLKKMQDTLLFYESPHRLKDFLKDVYEVMGDRRIALARELTKKYEEWIRGTVSEVLEWSDKEELRGEFCVVLEGGQGDDLADEKQWWTNLSIEHHVEALVEKGLSHKEAIKQVAKERGMQKREVYSIVHINEKE